MQWDVEHHRHTHGSNDGGAHGRVHDDATDSATDDDSVGAAAEVEEAVHLTDRLLRRPV